MAARKETPSPGRPAQQAGRLVHPEPPLIAGEEVRWRRPAGLSSGRSALGGTLYITSSRLIFVANRLSGPRRPPPVALPLSELASVAIEPRTGRPLLGGLPRRLRLQRAGDPEPLLFVVKHLDAVVAEVQALTGVGPAQR